MSSLSVAENTAVENVHPYIYTSKISQLDRYREDQRYRDIDRLRRQIKIGPENRYRHRRAGYDKPENLEVILVLVKNFTSRLHSESEDFTHTPLLLTYIQAFVFSPFSSIVDPSRIRALDPNLQKKIAQHGQDCWAKCKDHGQNSHTSTMEGWKKKE